MFSYVNRMHCTNRRPRIAAALLGVLLPICGHAATIDYQVQNGVNLISISGEIAAGDADRFGALRPDPRRQTGVLLASEGGAVTEALRIGEMIRASHFATLVPNDAICASACGLIWLAGTPRIAGPTSHVGCHAAYTRVGATASESGVANAVVGAYLDRLGLTYKAVVFMTSAAPTEMRWLNRELADQIGVAFVTLPEDPPSPPADPVSPPADPVPPPAATLAPREARIVGFVQTYYANWSGTGTSVSSLTPMYADLVNFYGSNVPKARVLVEKQKFVQRWPVRQYRIKPNTVFVQCAAVCSVTGVVAWDVSSAERGVRSVGTANFVLKISDDVMAIISENGAVLSNHTEALQSGAAAASVATGQSQPGVTPAGQPFRDGRQARIDYERWFEALADGDFKNGVLFWAANRGNKSLPSCEQPGVGVEWMSGCERAHTALADSDIRRKTEADFKLGWNSL
ncbi:hypothetical protein [Rhodopila sp.]|uniref:COG3904 family protein n=1 Tax=Rhodopila sp. TaxID=2480087 RepID=UPI003D0DB620